MCVSGVRSRVVSCERVRVSCEWASRRSSVVRREAFSFVLCEIPKFSCRVSNSSSSFRVEFWSRFSNSISRILEVVFWSRISNSSFSFRCFIRLLEFQFSIRISIRVSNASSLIFRVEFRIRLFRFVALFDFSNFNFRFEFVVEIFDVLLYSTSRISIRICRRNFRFVAQFDFSNFVAQFDFSNFDCRFDFSSQVPWISNSSFRLEFVVEFRIRLDLFDFSNFDSNLSSKLSFASRVLSLSSSSNFATFVARRSRCPICIALMHWRPQLFSHDRSRFALVATRALRALFVRKILVKRQFTFSLYFGIIEL